MVTYTMDYTNMSATDAQNYNIPANSPKKFDWKICVDDKTIYYKYFNYSYQGTPYFYEYKLTNIGPASPINPPTNFSGDSYNVLLDEMQEKGQLMSCYRLAAAADKDKCVALVALDLKSTKLCEQAGDRKDRCLVSVVALTLDPTICSNVNDAGYRDDCYTELAGGKKDSSFCSNIIDAAKKDYCMNISNPNFGNNTINESNMPPTTENNTELENATITEIERQILQALENADKNNTNTTNTSQ
jgi:hypothetical protein